MQADHHLQQVSDDLNSTINSFERMQNKEGSECVVNFNHANKVPSWVILNIQNRHPVYQCPSLSADYKREQNRIGHLRQNSDARVNILRRNFAISRRFLKVLQR